MGWTTKDELHRIAGHEQERSGHRFAYFSLATKGFEPGLVVLNECLRRVTLIPLVAMCTADVDLEILEEAGIHPVLVEEVNNPTTSKSKRFFRTYTKLRVFEFDEFERIVFLDADMLVLKSVDDLFSRTEEFLAAPDLGIELHHERFNSGMMVIKPSRTLFGEMLEKVGLIPSYDGSDQGFLNSFFHQKWTPLPKEDNLLVRLFEYHPEQCDLKSIRILHFVGAKPWLLGQVKEVYRPFFRMWYGWASHALCQRLLDQWQSIHQNFVTEQAARRVQQGGLGVFMRKLWGKN